MRGSTPKWTAVPAAEIAMQAIVGYHLLDHHRAEVGDVGDRVSPTRRSSRGPAVGTARSATR
jgi:hypothetical protein